jgi:esterase/lipase
MESKFWDFKVFRKSDLKSIKPIDREQLKKIFEKYKVNIQKKIEMIQSHTMSLQNINEKEQIVTNKEPKEVPKTEMKSLLKRTKNSAKHVKIQEESQELG